MVEKFGHHYFKTNQLKFNKSTQSFINQRIKKRCYKTLGISAIYSPIPPHIDAALLKLANAFMLDAQYISHTFVI